jgi:hypothetical protein
MQAKLEQQAWGTVALKATWIGIKWTGLSLVKLLAYLFSFQWIVDLVHWMIDIGGNIAESAFLLATLFVTVEVVAHSWVTWIIYSPDVLSSINQACIITFTALPELIIFQAIAVSFDHCQLAWRTKRIDAIAWAIAFAIPTLVFLVMTVITMTSFVSFEAVNKTTFQATGFMLVVRCLAGYWYGMVSMLFTKLGKKGYSHFFASLQTTISSLELKVSDSKKEKEETDKVISELQEKLSLLEQDLFASRLKNATRKTKNFTSQKTGNDNSKNPDADFKNDNFTPEENKNDSSKNGISKRDKLKLALRKAIISEAKINYRAISNQEKLSYSMVCKTAPILLEEIRSEEVPQRLHAV